MQFAQKMINLKNKKILLTGGGGFLGNYVFEALIKRRVKKENIFIPRSQEYDLRKRSVCNQVVRNKDIIIHLAALVGGIGFNQKNPASVFYDNASMALNLIDAAYKSGIEKFVGIGSVCSYPKFSKIPFVETDLWLGYPEETNAPYGLAKKMMLVQSQAYHKQYGFNAIHLLMINLYGPGDNFDPQSSHVVPALIKKIVNAKKNKLPFIEIWGSGKATREFLYVEDAAKGIILATEKYDKSDPVNIGCNAETSIKDLVGLICKIIKYKGEVRWDKTKPDGQPRRMLNADLAKKEFGFISKTQLNKGLKKTINWYIKSKSLV